MSISEQLEAEIDQAIEDSSAEETTVVSEGREEEVTVPVKEENSEETQGTPEEKQEEAQETPEEKQEETQEDTQLDREDTSGDTFEDSEEGTQEDSEDAVPEGISDDALTRAVNAGLSLAEARSFASEDVLNGISNRLEQQTQQYRTWAQEEQARHFQANQQQQRQEEEVDPFADLKLNPDDYEPEIVEKFEKLAEIVKGQRETIADFQYSQENAQASANEQSRVEIVDWFDKEISDLGEDFSGVVGTGKYNDLDRGSQQFANRDAIANQMSVLIAGYNAQGIPAPNRSDVFQTASRFVLSDQFVKVGNEKLSKQLEQQSTQHIQRANKSKATTVLTAEEQDKEIADSIDRQFFRK